MSEYEKYVNADRALDALTGKFTRPQVNRPETEDMWIFVDARSSAWRHVKTALRRISRGLAARGVSPHQVVPLELPRGAKEAKLMHYRRGGFPVRCISAYDVIANRIVCRMDVLVKASM